MKPTIIIFAFLNFFSFVFAGDMRQEDSNEENGDHLSGALADLSNCEGIIMYGAPLQGFPQELCTAPSLVDVLFVGCQINDAIPEEFWCNRQLKILDFRSCGITGILSPRLGKLLNLIRLNLCQNKLTGQIPPNLVKLKILEKLILSKNQFSKMPDLSALVSLTEIDCSENQLTGPLPRLPVGLKKLYLGHNQLEGTLTALFAAKGLKVLELANNNLRGPLRGIESVHGLEVLNLSENPLHMAFPKEILELYQLSTLEMANAGLTGIIPEEFCQLTNLGFVNLGQNYLDGEIPKKINQLCSLEFFIVNMNRLKGKLPQFAPSLKALLVCNNDLEGTFNVSDFPDLTQLGIFSVESATDRIYTAELNQLSAETLVHFLNIQKEVSGIQIGVTSSENQIGYLSCDYDLDGRRALIFHFPSGSDDEKNHISAIQAMINLANLHLGRRKNVIDVDSNKFIN